MRFQLSLIAAFSCSSALSQESPPLPQLGDGAGPSRFQTFVSDAENRDAISLDLAAHALLLHYAGAQGNDLRALAHDWNRLPIERMAAFVADVDYALADYETRLIGIQSALCDKSVTNAAEFVLEMALQNQQKNALRSQFIAGLGRTTDPDIWAEFLRRADDHRSSVSASKIDFSALVTERHWHPMYLQMCAELGK